MTTRDASTIQEKIIAKRLGGTRTPNSGATPFTKGDIVMDVAIIECKTKMKDCDGFQIKKDWLETLEEERRGMGKQAATLAFSFDQGQTNYYILDEKNIKRYLEYLQRDSR